MIFDLHNDFLTSPKALITLSKKQASLADKSYSDMITYAIWTTRLKNPVRFIKKIVALKIKNTAIEDLHFVQDENLYILKQLRPLYVSLTWNGENKLAGGANTDEGLSPFGKSVIKYLTKAGIILDTAHLSKQAFFQAADASSRPIICSHTCFDGVHTHKRNISDLQIKILIDSGGLIGLCLVPEFMGKAKATAQDIVRQIDYFTQKFGADNLCIGTDFYGTDYPAIDGYCGFNRVMQLLKGLGYRQKDINRIFYKNALDFFKK